MKKVKGSALPMVLVVSVLICLMLLFTFSLFDINSLLYSSYQYRIQRKEFLNSSFVLYCHDSTLIPLLKNNNYKYQLYEDNDSSIVRFTIMPWGFYEVVNVSSIDRKFQSTRILGKDQDCKQEAALWVCNRDMPLSLGGNTQIEGPVFAPTNGINYIQLGNIPFSGKMIENYNIHFSNKELPPTDSIYLKEMNTFFEKEKKISHPLLVGGEQHYYSFTQKTSYFTLSPESKELDLQGNVVLYGDEVIIPSKSRLNNIILIAKKVIVEDGFSGSMQILASDTVILKNNVQLHYPSGVYLNGNKGKTYLKIGSLSRLEGYALIEGKVEKENMRLIPPNYYQDSDAAFCGLLYVNGIADINGIISGAAYIKECYYLPPNGIYAGTLFDTKIERDNQVAYPFFFKTSAFLRREIKSVY